MKIQTLKEYLAKKDSNCDSESLTKPAQGQSKQEIHRKLISGGIYCSLYVAAVIIGVSIYGLSERQRALTETLLPGSPELGALSPDTLLALSLGTCVVGGLLYFLSLSGWLWIADDRKKIIALLPAVIFGLCVIVPTLVLYREQTVGLRRSAEELRAPIAMETVMSRVSDVPESPAYLRRERLERLLKCCGVGGAADYTHERGAPSLAQEKTTPNRCRSYQEGCLTAVGRFADQQEVAVQALTVIIIVFAIQTCILIVTSVFYVPNKTCCRKTEDGGESAMAFRRSRLSLLPVDRQHSIHL